MTLGRRHSEHARCVCETAVAPDQGGHTSIYAVSAPVSFNLNDLAPLRRSFLRVNPRGNRDGDCVLGDIVSIRLMLEE
jgi:hypothetical protein